MSLSKEQERVLQSFTQRGNVVEGRVVTAQNPVSDLITLHVFFNLNGENYHEETEMELGYSRARLAYQERVLIWEIVKKVVQSLQEKLALDILARLHP